MAIYKLFPQQDATIYSSYPLMNAGLDSILEVNNITPSPSYENQVARSLVKFNQDEIDEVIDSKVSSSLFEAYLKMYIADAEGLLLQSNIEAYPLYESWMNGEGRFEDDPENTNGVSWIYRDYYNGNNWSFTNLPPYVKNSFPDDNIGGGTWFTGSNHPGMGNLKATQSLDLKLPYDLNLDVTNTLKAWYSSSKDINDTYINIPNNGFIIKWEDSIEFNTTSSVQPSFRFYSIDTHTIYPPELVIKWDDSTYITGSLPSLNSNDIFIGIKNNPGRFYRDSINKFRVNARPMYPPRVYQTSSIYTNNYALPSQSYWALKDIDTNEYVIDFDEQFTKLSCDNRGNYFTLYMNGLEPERNYSILIKTIINGETIIKNDNYYFKIING